MEVFDGLHRVYGRYVVPEGAKPDAKGKITGVRDDGASGGSTRHGEVTVALWEDHLAGRAGLGIVPINDESKARFGAADIDVYPLDLKVLQEHVEKLKLPVIICRTKSGGAHVYLFTSEFVPAALMRAKLTEWAALLGYRGCEVFPKQERLTPDADGNWINAPYFSGARTTRYALGPGGKGLTPEEFLELVEQTAISEDELRKFKADADDPFEEGPPCLQTLASQGFGDWQNSGLFAIAVYLRKRFGNNEPGGGGAWHGYVEEYNKRFISPPLPPREMAGVIKSVSKTAYNYTCSQDPLCKVCDKKTCKTRDYGISPGALVLDVDLGDLEKLETDPITWILRVKGEQIELTTEILMDQRKFHALCIERLNIWPTLVKAHIWQETVRARLAKALMIHVPEDATKKGQMWVHLGKFCSAANHMAQRRSLDEILMGKPFIDDASGRVYFSATDFLGYLSQHRVGDVSTKDLYRWLRERGVEHHTKIIKKKCVNFWSVPVFEEQAEEHAVPRTTPKEGM
jgi:hypothetical protein